MKLKLVNEKNPESLVSEKGKKLAPSGIREFFDIVYSTPDCISLGVGEPDFTTPWTICDAGIQAIKDGSTHYTPNRGLPELRELISAYLENTYELAYSPDTEMIVTLGVSQGLDLALRSIINPGDEVIVFEPCYVSYAANIDMLHGVPVGIPTDRKRGFAIDVNALEKAITPRTKAVLLNYPANPTGATIDGDTLERIARLAIRNNILVISDELYSAITYDTGHRSIATIPGMKERTIYLNGFSKSHAMTGWRLGYVAGPKYLIDIMLKIHQYVALCASSIAQIAAVDALRLGNTAVQKMRTEYTRRRNYVVNTFNEIGLPCHVPGGAFYVFPDITPTGLASREFALRLLREQKVAVVPGTAFGPVGEGHVRCSYATSMENLKESLKRIGKFTATLKT